jgi:hypothetical protein
LVAAILFMSLLHLALLVAAILFMSLLLMPLLFVAILLVPLRFVPSLIMLLRFMVLLLVARSIAFPLFAHFLIVAQAFIFPLFPCQTFTLQPQTFASRRPTFTFQHLLSLVVVVIPLALSIRPIVVVITILKAERPDDICNAGKDSCGV